MEKRKKAFIFGLAGCLAVCCAPCRAEENEKEGALRAVIFYQSQIWVQDINIMQQIADSIEEHLDGYPGIAFSSYGVENISMTEAIKAAVGMKTDVMIFYGIDSEEAKKEYQMLKDRGIRLILADGDAQSSGRFAYVGTDNYEGGVQAADLIAQKKGAGTSVAVLAPNLDTTLCSVGGRLRGFKEAAPSKELDIQAYCETTYDSLTAIQQIETLLDEHPDVEVLYCAEAVSGQAAADVVEERGLKDQIMVITYDINQNIEEDLISGALDVTLMQDTEAIGQACAEKLIALAEEPEMESTQDVLFSCIPMTAHDIEGE